MPQIMKFVIPGILGFTILFSFIEMILAAILINSYNNSGYPTTQLKNTTRYALFVSLWNLFIGGAYLAFNFILTSSIIASVASNAVFFAVTWLLWLACGAAVADSLGGPLSCNNPEFAHCNQLNALQAFAWINFIIFFITFVYILFLGFKASRKGDGYTGPLVQV